MDSKPALNCLQSTLLGSIHTIGHGFYTRYGGVSAGSFSSLNVSYAQDEPQLVCENRRRVVHHLNSLSIPSSRTNVNNAVLFAPRLCHSADVYVLDDKLADPDDHALSLQDVKADAIVTKIRGYPLCVYTADCAPVLLCDKEAGVIAAAHAGWRGALNGIMDNTVAAMERLGAKPENIVAAIGPCIQQNNYEVGQDLVDRFSQKHGSTSDCFFITPPGKERQHFNVPKYVAYRLSTVGVMHCDSLPECTMGDERFFSYRRNCKTGISGFGCQPSVIMLT